MKDKITRVTLDEFVTEDRTDWAYLDALTQEQLEQAIAADPDADVPNVEWTKGRLVMPQRKDSIHMRIDPDMLQWYKQSGRGYLTRMHAVLRAYYEAHRNDEVHRDKLEHRTK